jgi:hypothetical protein
MKLIDLLVQELPKRGGWPEGADWCVYHDIDEEVSFGYGLSPLLIDGTWTTTENDSHWLCRGDFYHQNSNDFNAAIVTSDQYEAALAASQKVEWSGDGLPPVGVKCEIIINEGNLGLCEIIFVGQSLLVWRQDSTYQEGSGYHRHMKFRPLRSEEDKKRDAAVEAIDYWLPEFIPDTPNEYYHAKKIYDAIAAGKIPGVSRCFTCGA